MVPMQKSLHSDAYQRLLALLRVARKDAGVSQAELASRLGTTQTFVSKCERGERRLDVIELRTWCRALGVSTTDLLTALEHEGGLHR